MYQNKFYSLLLVHGILGINQDFRIDQNFQISQFYQNTNTN